MMRLGLYSKILGAAALLAMSALPFAPAQAAAGDVANGVYFGTGNVNGGWSITTDAGSATTLEVGLRAKIRGGSVVTPVGSDYTVPTGSPPVGYSTWNWEFSIDLNSTNVAMPGVTLADYTAMMTITDITTGQTTGAFNVLTTYGDNAKDGIGGSGPWPADSAATRAQNSENMKFAPHIPGFSPWNAHTYNFALVVAPNSGVDGPSATATMTVNAVPEPASMALLGAGLFGLGLIRRRRRT